LNISSLLSLAREAGEAILRFHGTEAGVEAKADDSPLTLADKASHEIIVAGLRELTPDIPIISEESAAAEHGERRHWTQFWLVDPLDGTKEFLKQTGEFTVNIGLVQEGVPVLGVVYAPAIDLCYWSDGTRAWKQQGTDEAREIHSGEYVAGTSPVLVASRDHAGPEVTKLVERHPGAQFRSMGSSLKFCLVAEGAADVYLRDVPTMEWDTAAAHAVLLASGATLRRLDGQPLAYNKPELRNPAIVTVRPGAEALLGA